MNPNHIYSLDHARGIAAIAVCLFHFTDKPGYLSDDNLLKQIGHWGHFGVEIFFIVSALVIPLSFHKAAYTLTNAWRFFKKRLVRIEPPYLVSIALALLLNYLTSIMPGYKGYPFQLNWEQIIAHIGYLAGFFDIEWINHVYWTLAVEFQYYILIALFMPLVRARQELPVILFLAFFNCTSFYFDRNYIFNFSIFFTIGIILYRYRVGLASLQTAYRWAFVITLYMAYVYSYREIVIALITVCIIQAPLKYNWIGCSLGNISFSLYLLHYIIGLRVIHLTMRYTDNENTRMAMVGVAILVSILAGTLYYYLIERPSKLAGQRIKYTPKPQSINTSLQLEELPRGTK